MTEKSPPKREIPSSEQSELQAGEKQSVGLGSVEFALSDVDAEKAAARDSRNFALRRARCCRLRLAQRSAVGREV